MRIFVAGLTGSGKSSVAKYLAKKFKLKYISSSMLFREFAKKDTKSSGWWTKEGLKFIEERKNSDIDKLFDKYLLELCNREDNFVMDSWTMPWLYKGECLRIYLRAPEDTRVERITSRDSHSNKSDAKSALIKKDKITVDLYKSKYGFDISNDLNSFDLIINTKYTSEKDIHQYVSKYIAYVRRI